MLFFYQIKIHLFWPAPLGALPPFFSSCSWTWVFWFHLVIITPVRVTTFQVYPISLDYHWVLWVVWSVHRIGLSRSDWFPVMNSCVCQFHLWPLSSRFPLEATRAFPDALDCRAFQPVGSIRAWLICCFWQSVTVPVSVYKSYHLFEHTFLVTIHTAPMISSSWTPSFICNGHCHFTSFSCGLIFNFSIISLFITLLGYYCHWDRYIDITIVSY